jgi:integrase
VRCLITTAEAQAEKARAALAERPDSRARTLQLWRAEQNVLLVRLAADTGARRGELTALRIDDLNGRVLSIDRAAKGAIVGPTKTHQRRRLTLGATAAAYWIEHVDTWKHHPMADVHPGQWLFAADPRRQPMLPASLSHRFARLAKAAGIPTAHLHRLRHTVGTVLVSHGHILKAAARLGHRDPATTLRHYTDALPSTTKTSPTILTRSIPTWAEFQAIGGSGRRTRRPDRDEQGYWEWAVKPIYPMPLICQFDV